MTNTPFTLQDDYWDSFEVQNPDLEFLYNHLLDLEEPQTPQELARAMVFGRIQQEKINLAAQQKDKGSLYLPKEVYKVGETLLFPALKYQHANVVDVRPGANPNLVDFQVIEVEFENGEKKQFAAGLEDHYLNTPEVLATESENLNPEEVMNNYGDNLVAVLSGTLEENEDLVRIAGKWFPRALLVDINAGHLNLAEAVLDMTDGQPLPTSSIIQQIDLPIDVNARLTEFSLNLALQEDERFDEVGPAGEIIWFLKRLEPDEVQQPPAWLGYQKIDYDQSVVAEMVNQFEGTIADEIEPQLLADEDANEVTISLIYPHWRSGTLPLSKTIRNFFPTAYESPRVQFSFIDEENGQAIPGWVVRPSGFVYGLREWYESYELIPGSLVTIKRGKNPGEVIIKAHKKRPSRQWIRTILVGSDGGIVFAMLKQLVTASYDDRMVIAVPDVDALDNYWDQPKNTLKSLNRTVIMIMRELTKLNPQGHIHAQELYAATNVIRRCPPGAIINLLINQPWAVHQGDLYFRLDEKMLEA
jgi:hypothetical protein